MENTAAFTTLMDLISVLSSFVNSPIFFGISFLQILVISVLFHMLIGLLLGGIMPRSHITNVDNRVLSVNQERVLNFYANDYPAIGVGNRHLLGGGK